MSEKLYTYKEAIQLCKERTKEKAAKAKAAREAKKAARPAKEVMSLIDAKELYAFGRITQDKDDMKKGTAAMKKHGVLPSKFIKTQEYLNMGLRLYPNNPELRNSLAFRQDAKAAMSFGSTYSGTVYDILPEKKPKKPRKKST